MDAGYLMDGSRGPGLCPGRDLCPCEETVVPFKGLSAAQPQPDLQPPSPEVLPPWARSRITWTPGKEQNRLTLESAECRKGESVAVLLAFPVSLSLSLTLCLGGSASVCPSCLSPGSLCRRTGLFPFWQLRVCVVGCTPDPGEPIGPVSLVRPLDDSFSGGDGQGSSVGKSPVCAFGLGELGAVWVSGGSSGKEPALRV